MQTFVYLCYRLSKEVTKFFEIRETNKGKKMATQCILTRQHRNQPPTHVDVSFGLEWGGKIRIDSVELQGREVLKFLGQGFRQEIEDQIQDSLQDSEETAQEGWIYNLGEW